jgi:hypothetical protein
MGSAVVLWKTLPGYNSFVDLIDEWNYCRYSKNWVEEEAYALLGSGFGFLLEP